MKKKLLFVNGSMKSGGVEKSLISLLKSIDYEKYEVDLFLFQNEGLFLQQVPDKVRILSCEKFSFREYLKRGAFRKAFRLLCSYVENYKQKNLEKYCGNFWKNMKDVFPKFTLKYDVAIAYNDGYALYFVVDNVVADKKIAWNHIEYTADFCYKPGLDGKYYDKLDYLVSVSVSCADILKSVFPKLRSKIYVIENILNKDFIHMQANERNPYPNTDGLKIVSVGRLCMQKGYDYGISALSFLKKKGIPFDWYIIGVGELQSSLQEQVEKAHMQGQVHFMQEQVNPYIFVKNADIFLQTSRVEGKSITIEEAKLLHKPIVVTNYPTVGDQIIDGVSGLIADMNPESIYTKILMLLENPLLKNDLHNYLSCNEVSNQLEMINRVYSLLES